MNESKKIEKRMDQSAVIGLGRFGKSVALTLASLGKDVLAIDTNPELVKKVENFVSGAVVADSTGTDVLFNLGIQNFDCVVICIGEDLQASIFTTLLCKDLGVKYIVAKAQNDQHKKVLERIGADMAVFPETYMGKKVASILANPSQNEVMSLTDKFKIVEISTPDYWAEKSIGEMNIRNKYKVTIIFIKRGEEVISPEPDTILYMGDILVIAGDINKINAISNKSNEVLDAKHSLMGALEEEV